VSIFEQHEREILLPRGLTAEQAEKFGVVSVRDTEHLYDLAPEFQGSRYAQGSGLLFTWNSPVSGVVRQFRPDDPVVNDSGDRVKYAFPAGQQMVLNQLRLNGDGPLLIQEGTLQSIAAAVYTHDGWSVVGMSGCWSWRRGETSVATPDLLVCDGRDVVIGLDADTATNRDVFDGGVALAEACMAEGAHSVTFLQLSGQGGKAGLDDVLGARPADRRTDYLMRALQHTTEKPAKARPVKKAKSNPGLAIADPSRPTVMINADRRDVINELTGALQSKWDSTELFGYGGILAQRDEATMHPITEGMFADLVSEAALTVTVNAKGEMNPAWPDAMTCKAVLSRADRFARLDRISLVPFIRPDGSICQAPGYDETTATFLLTDESASAIEVPDEPTADEVSAAVKLLCDEWLGDLMAIMPEPEDRANCLALALTPFIRGMVPLAPLAVIDGLQMGVGKNLLADVISILTHGTEADPLPYSREDEENKKVITASFRAGKDLLVFDEAHVIEGRHLARSITSVTYSDRILGVSNMIEFPNKVTWVALGNNVSVNGDLSRRVYRIRLAPTSADPQDRDSSAFRHPNLRRWTRDHRVELVSACLTVIRAWFVLPESERPENVNGRRFGSFEQWGGMVGGILDNAGVPGFLGSLREWRSETDFEGQWWSAHLSWLRSQFADTEFTIRDVVQAMRKAPQGTVEHPPRLEDHSVTGYNRTLGLAYGRVKNRLMAGMQLVKTAETSGHGNRWRVLSKGSDLPAAETGQMQAPDLAEARAKDEDLTPSAPEANPQVNPGIDSEGRKGRSATPPMTKNLSTYNVYACIEGNSEGGAAPVYPIYPNYPPADVSGSADPLASLIPLTSPAPVPVCPDCDKPEQLTPAGFWFACPRCAPLTFAERA
jgi:hypothetical protein